MLTQGHKSNLLMKINIHSIHFTSDKKLINFIEKKIEKLVLFDSLITSADVYLKLEPSTELDNKVADIKLSMAKSEIFASKHCKTFEEAVDLSAEALRKQILKNKEKKRA
jgi:putative sigma-54 modulation protein